MNVAELKGKRTELREQLEAALTHEDMIAAERLQRLLSWNRRDLEAARRKLTA